MGKTGTAQVGVKADNSLFVGVGPESDPGYVARYDGAFGLPGLAAFCREAIHANADRAAR